MNAELQPPPRLPVEEQPGAERPRLRFGWHHHLAEVKQGIRQCCRSNSTFFVHFFVISITVAAGMVLGLSLMRWSLIILAGAMVISAEMFQQVLRAIWVQVGDKLDKGGSGRILAMGTAAVFVTIVGAVIVVLAVLATQFGELFRGLQ